MPSHLAPVDGAPLLHRTVAQACSISGDVHVTSPNDDRYIIDGTIRHVRGQDYPNEYVSTRELWNTDGRTVLLLGDVYFTAAAIRAVETFTARTLRVFGRRARSRHTGTPYGEIFAASWWPEHHALLDQHLAQVVGTFTAGTSNRQDGWTLLRSIQGTPLNKHIVKSRYFTEVDDWTDDLDCPADYARHPATRHR